MKEIDDNIEKVKLLLSKRSEYAELEKHGGDHPQTDDVWLQLANTIAIDEDEAIDIIDILSEEEIYWLSEVFDDISEKLQSEKFVAYLRKLQKKFPDIDLSVDIEFAQKALNKATAADAKSRAAE